jgi:hypothetical protein
MEAFFGPSPPGHIVNHKNGIKHDCRPENLCYCTHKENAAHARANGLAGQNWAIGERNGSSKLTAESARDIRRLAEEGCGIAQLARRYGVCFTTVWNVIVKRNWKHVTP